MVRFEYDNKGHKTAVIVNGDRLPISEKAFNPKALNPGSSDGVFITGKNGKYLFTGDYELTAYQTGDNYYYGDGTIMAQIKPDLITKGMTHIVVNFKDGKQEEWNCTKLNCNFSAQGLHITLYYRETFENWWDHAVMDIKLLPNGTVNQIGPNINGDLRWFVVKEIDKDGTYVIKNKDGIVRKFGNNQKGLVWSGWWDDDTCWIDKENYLTKKTCKDRNEFYITQRDGLNIQGYEIIHNPVNHIYRGTLKPEDLKGIEPDEFFDFCNVDYMPEHEIAEGAKVSFDCDQYGNIIRRDEAGYWSECNLRNDDVRKYDPKGNLLFQRSGTYRAIYIKGPNGKTRLKYDCSGHYHHLHTIYVYQGDALCKTVDLRYDVVEQRNFYDAKGRVIRRVKYNIGATPVEILYTYYKDGFNKETITTIKDGRKTFEHYAIDGKEDTINYLADEHVNARKQAIMSKHESCPKVVYDIVQKIISTDLFNRIAKNRAIRAVKKSR